MWRPHVTSGVVPRDKTLKKIRVSFSPWLWCSCLALLCIDTISFMIVYYLCVSYKYLLFSQTYLFYSKWALKVLSFLHFFFYLFHPVTLTFIQALLCHICTHAPIHQKQLGVKYFAQGYFKMQTGIAGESIHWSSNWWMLHFHTAAPLNSVSEAPEWSWWEEVQID